MTDRMERCLRQALTDSALGEQMNEVQTCMVFAASMKLGAVGFRPSTLWRALEIATEEPTDAG